MTAHRLTIVSQYTIYGIHSRLTLVTYLQTFSERFLQQPITEVTNRAGGSYTVTSTDAIIFNTWTGGNGTSIIYLPTTTGNEGRIIRFKSGSAISAVKNIQIRPDDVSEIIDGATSYDFDRSYDGLSLLCHDGEWFIIQKKENDLRYLSNRGG